MATKVAAKEVFGTRIEQAKIIVDHLSHLKGAAMKAGQLLSLESSDFLPPEAIEILSKLQSEAKPADTRLMKEVLLRELGKDKYGHIREFSDAPVAAASIGQVHRATLHGEPVAIKIQYPGVAKSIDSDLAILKSLAQSFIKVSGKKFELDETFAEIRDVLKNETNYLLERENSERYRAALENYQEYIVPRTYPEYSTERVLTMSYEEGVPLSKWISTRPSQKARTRITQLVLELFCREFVATGLVQTDPNFGNFLIRETQDPHSPQLVLLDFGATLSYSKEFRQGYARLLKDLATNDVKTIFQSAVNFGLLDPRESDEAQIAFKNMISISLEPFNPEKQPFHFADVSFEKRNREANLAFSKALVYSPPPKKLIFLHRKLGGIFNWAKKMGVTLDLRPYWQQMTAE